MSVAYKDRTHEELKQELASAQAAYEALKAQNLEARTWRAASPARSSWIMVIRYSERFSKTPEDMHVATASMSATTASFRVCPSAKRLFADILGCKPEECFVGGNASLTLMYDAGLQGAIRTACCTLGKAVVQARYRQVALPRARL